MMFKRIRSTKKETRALNLLIAGILALVAVGTAHAQTPELPRVQHSDPFWQVVYWNNRTLSGAPAIVATDLNLNHDWGSGSPPGGVGADRFSARWTRYVDVNEAGTYRFSATADDGIRVRVDGELIIDEWRDQSASTFVGDVHLAAGHHQVLVEYYENMGAAVAKLTWWGPLPTAHGSWRGEYFANRYLIGPPTLVRNDAVAASGGLAFNWGAGYEV